MKLRHYFFPSCFAVVCSLVPVMQVGATTYQWDPNGATAGLGAAGTWNTSGTTWDLVGTGLDDGTDATVAHTFTNTDKAIFGGTFGLVSLGSPVTINALQFDTSGYTIGSNTLTLAGSSPTITTNANAIITSVIAGTSGMIKAGSGELTLSATNTYSGGTTVSQGTVILNGGSGNTSNLGSGPLTIESGAKVITGYAGANWNLGTIVSAHRVQTVNINGGTLQFNNTTTGSGGISVVNFNLTGGAITKGTGTGFDWELKSADGGAKITTLASNTTSTIAPNMKMRYGSGNNLTLDVAQGTTSSGQDLVISGDVSTDASNGIIKTGAGNAVLSGTGSSYAGATNIQSGVLSVSSLANGGSNSSIGASANTADKLLFGDASATLRYIGTSNASTNRGFTMSSGAGGGATIESSGTGTLTFDNTVAINYGTSNQTRVLTLGGSNTGANTFGKVIADNGSGATSLVKSGNGTWTLTANNTHTGGTVINGGKMNVSTDAQLGSGSVLVNGGELHISGAVTKSIELAGGKITGNAATIPVNVTGAGALTGTLGVVDTGTSSNRVINTTGGLSVTSLSGQGEFTGGAVTITGTHNPGNSPGTQTFDSGLSYANGSTLNLEIAGDGLTYDQLFVTGGLTIGSNVNVNVNFSGSADYTADFWNTDHTYNLLTTDTVSGSFAGLSTTGLGTSDQGSWSLTGINGDLVATWTAVPEASSTLLVGLGAFAMTLRRRRR